MNAPMTQPLHDEDLARADAYAVLARLLFAPPDAALLTQLHAAQREGSGELSECWNALCAAATDAESIAAEYNALFVSIGKPPVSLYASWHLTGFLMEKPLALLRDDLAALGLERQPGQNDPEDHIAGELDVMRHLILAAHSAPAQADFFGRHLAPWCGKFCAALASAPQADFYRALAQFMRAFLEMESAYFAVDGGVK